MIQGYDYEEIDMNGNRGFIYGAGTYAKCLFIWLSYKGLNDSICGFIVSNKKNNADFLYDKPVLLYDDIYRGLSGYLLYVALGEKNTAEVKEKLKGVTVKHIEYISKKRYNEMKQEVIEYYSSQPIIRNKIFVDAFFGMGYTCNCKYTIEALHKLCDDIDVVWYYTGEDKDSFPAWVRTVKPDTLEYYEEVLTAGIYLTNVDFCSFQNKRPEQYFIDTWHGTGPFKKVNLDRPEYQGDNERIKTVRNEWSRVDLMIAASGHCHVEYRNAFLYSGEIQDWGYPRNDVFFRKDGLRERVRDKLGIAYDTGIVLYAPTFREEFLNSQSREEQRRIFSLDSDRLKEALSKKFKKEFVFLYRFHHHVYRHNDIEEFYPDDLNVTMYSDMQELLIASDVLITDYSSCMWDFSLTKRPVFLYFTDGDDYMNKERGLYLSPDKYPYPNAHSMEELCDAIMFFDEVSYRDAVRRFIDSYGSYDDGHASERLARRIIDVMRHPEAYGKG